MDFYICSQRTGMMKKMVNGQPQPFPTRSTRAHGSQRFVESAHLSWMTYPILWYLMLSHSFFQKIKNPNYKGKWKAPLIDNPGFFSCLYNICVFFYEEFNIIIIDIYIFLIYRLQGWPRSLCFPKSEVCGSWTVASKKVSFSCVIWLYSQVWFIAYALITPWHLFDWSVIYFAGEIWNLVWQYCHMRRSRVCQGNCWRNMGKTEGCM